MRVVPYYGDQANRQMIEEHELFTDETRDKRRLRTHVVVRPFLHRIGERANVSYSSRPMKV